MNQMKYYKKELDDMNKWVKECNISILDNMQNFMNEANKNMTGIDKDVVDRVAYYIRKFKENCNCYQVKMLTTKIK